MNPLNLRRVCLFSVVAAGAFVVNPLALAGDIAVPTDHPTLQAAVNAAVNGDVIIVADGTYSGPGNVNVRLNGKAITVRSANGAAVCTINCNSTARAFILNAGETASSHIQGFTITNGAGVNDPTLSSSTSGGAIYVQDSSPTISECVFASCQAVNGGAIFASSFNVGSLDISDCAFNLSSANSGGAIYLRSIQGTVTNCSFNSNSATVDGSALRGFDSCPVVTGCTFTANGGPQAVYVNTLGMGCSNPIFTDCVFDGNLAQGVQAQSVSTSFDGCTFSNQSSFGFRHAGGVHSFLDCTFTGNSGRAIETFSGVINVDECAFDDNPGGGMRVGSSVTATIRDSAFRNNQGPSGAGLWVQSGLARLSGCVFEDNIAAGGANPYGGGAFVENGTAHFANCTFVGNQAASNGGGLAYLSGQPGTVVNCIFNNNSASFGGGISARNIRLRIANCVAVNNTASSQGGGIYNIFGNSQQRIGNSILRGNAPNEVFDDFSSASTIRYTNIEGGWSGAGSDNVDIDPVFTDSDGADDVAGTLDDDFRPTAGSPCIDAGYSWLVTADAADADADLNLVELAPLDRDGNPRFADDDGVMDTGCGNPVVVDIGAYEFQGDPARFVPKLGDLDQNGTVNVEDLLAVIGAWGPCGTGCCMEDFDANGVINVEDLLALIGSWG